MEIKYMEVDFATYCPKCMYSSRPEKCDPCNECLEFGEGIETRVPINYEEKGAKKNGK